MSEYHTLEYCIKCQCLHNFGLNDSGVMLEGLGCRRGEKPPDWATTTNFPREISGSFLPEVLASQISRVASREEDSEDLLYKKSEGGTMDFCSSIVNECSLRFCARCGKPHEKLEMKKFKNPPDDWDYWATCPTTGEPILVSIVEGEPECEDETKGS